MKVDRSGAASREATLSTVGGMLPGRRWGHPSRAASNRMTSQSVNTPTFPTSGTRTTTLLLALAINHGYDIGGRALYPTIPPTEDFMEHRRSRSPAGQSHLSAQTTSNTCYVEIASMPRRKHGIPKV